MSRLVAVLVTALVGALVLGPELASATRPTAARAIVAEVRRDVWLPPQLRTMDLAGSNKLTVAQELRRGGRGRWSPDGLRIGGYHKPTGSGHLLDGEGGRQRHLANRPCIVAPAE